MAERGVVKDKDADEAMSAIIAKIRDMQASGEITLIQND
jgi:flagellar motor switch protein FliG